MFRNVRKHIFSKCSTDSFFPHFSKLEEVVLQPPPVPQQFPLTIHFNKLYLLFCSCLSSYSFVCTSSYWNESFHFSYMWTSDAVCLLTHSLWILWLEMGFRFPMFAQANFLLSSVRSSKDESSLWEAAKNNHTGKTAVRTYGVQKLYVYVLDGGGCCLWQCTIMQLITWN